MAALKTARTLQSSTTNTAGSTTTGTALDLATTFRFGGVATLQVTNGGTGPTVACDAIIEASVDNSTFYQFSRQTAPTTASAVTVFNVEIPIGLMYIRSKFTGNTAQSVTVLAVFHEVTSIT